MKNTMTCVTQNKLGALDRVLGAFTCRGFMPEQFVATIDDVTGHLQIIVTFRCEDEKTIVKLVKFLQKQVYVIEADCLSAHQSRPSTFATDPGFTSLLSPIVAKRRPTHVQHHA